MAKRKNRSVASESRLFVLALGLLVGFVIAFVFLLSRLPVDSIISQYNDGVTTGVEVEDMNFDYYAVLQAQKAARKPVRQVEPPVVYMEPPKQLLPQIQPTVEPSVVPRAAPQPRIEQPPVRPRIEHPAVQPRIEQPVIQPRIQQPVIVQPPVQQQPQLQALPQVRPAPSVPAQRVAPVREIMASDAGQDSYYVEAGSYSDNDLAVQVQSALRSLGLEAFIVVRQDNRGNFGHRVRIGPFLEQARLDETRARLRASGITPKLIRVKG